MQSIATYLKTPLAILMLGVFFICCKKSDFAHDNLMTYHGKLPDEATANLNLSFSDSGKVSFSISAPLLNKYSGENKYMDCPEGITIISYDPNGVPEAKLQADYAISEEKTHRLEARRNVVITNLKSHDTLLTKKIVWDKRSKRIYSNTKVEQHRPDGTVNIGDGFDADERFSKYTVRNPRGQVIAKDL